MLFFLACNPAPYKKYDVQQIQERWDEEIATFDVQNQAGLPEDPILFYGSSSFRLWSTLAEDMAPAEVVNRGFGGSTLHDGAFYARRVLAPVDYRALALFFANDIYGNEKDKSPAEMRKLIHYIVKTSRKLHPEAPVYLLEITQSPLRKNLVAEWDAANQMMADYAADRDYVTYIPTRDIFLNENDETKPELFREDGLHLNADGYELWRERVREYLEIKNVEP